MSKIRFLLMLVVLLLLGGVLYLTPALAAGPYQAENAVVGGGALVQSSYTGFLGTGFVNFNWSGGYVEFRNVDGGAGGSATLKLRHALGSTSARTGRLTVNGASQNITFSPTGAWTTWAVKEVVVNLTSGTTNTIRLASNGQDLANLDQLEVVPAGPTITPTTPVLCDRPVPVTSVSLSVTPTTLQVGETTQMSFTLQNLGMPNSTLYDGSYVIASFASGGQITISNESPTVRLISGIAQSAVLEAVAPGTADLKVSTFGEAVLGYGYLPQCFPVLSFVTKVSNIVPVTVSNVTPTPTPTQGPVGAGITTGQAKNVTANSAVLNSTSTILGSPQQVVVSYAYWETSNPAVVTTVAGQTYSGLGDFYDEVPVTGLKANTQYTYHAIGRFMFEGTITARDVTFTTNGTGPTPCSPVTSIISVPFTFDGAGTACWQTSSLGSYINSWNLDSLTINGVEYKNRWIGPPFPPPPIDGKWYIGYRASFPWSHFEMK